MAIEAKRGCGYRKVGGLYLVADGAGMPCCKMPLALTVCPCCGAGIKQTRGWTWVDAGKLFPSGGCVADPMSKIACPAVNPAIMGRVGLVWVGEKFYPRPIDFLQEAARDGISRRLPAVPRGFKAGETWVLFAHPKAIEKPREVLAADGGGFEIRCPEGTKDDVVEGDVFFETREQAERRAAELDLKRPLFIPGVIRISKPRGFEKIVKQSDMDNALAEKLAREGGMLADSEPSKLFAEFEKDRARGVKWIPVPDNDPDHQGNVYDDAREEEPA